MLNEIPGRQWALTMTEGSELPDEWADAINRTCERVIVPCEWNRQAFVEGGVNVPVHVVPGGTCPTEFPQRHTATTERPYTFLALADRGARKGWGEVWQAFYKGFRDNPDVRLIIKSRPYGNELIDRMALANYDDDRVTFWREDIDDMSRVYSQADCVVIPSRGEGWGMPPREAAMMGIPVITTRAGGLDDGYTEAWSLVVDNGRWEDIPTHPDKHIKGQWFKADIDNLVERMLFCFNNPGMAALHGRQAAKWLRRNQTWQHAAESLMEVICQN
jgi:glycosyltransferase involved in cell wall biosynthesis